MTDKSFSIKAWGTIALIFATVALLYGHTLHAPFYLDDQWAIIDKHLLRDLPATIKNIFGQRGLTYLSFALNYRLTGLSLPALHLTNIALHAGCGILVWLLLMKVVQKYWLALFGALLFVAHPLQTQAVTYLVQRSTVLGAFFFFLAILGHLRVRDILAAEGRRNHSDYLLPWLGAILAGACAVLSKENTATLVVVLIAYDRIFPLPTVWNLRQQCVYYLPFVVVPLALGMTMLGGEVKDAPILPLASLVGNSPLVYLVTEFTVFWIYLRLLLVPYGQALEHNFPVTQQLLTPQNSLALAGLLILSWLVWRVRHSRPLFTFGVVWFFLALAVESTVIPLDPLFEHRLYLPMFGFILALLGGTSIVFDGKRVGVVLGVALLICLPLTWQRNDLWNDPIRLYEDNLRQVPGSERASETLAIFYARAGRYDEERRLLERTLRQYPRNYIAYVNLAATYAEEERMDEAFALLEVGMQELPTNYKLYEAAAELAQRGGDQNRAHGYLLRGLMTPGADRGILLNDLGLYFAGIGDSSQAERAFRDSLSQDSTRPATHLNLGKELFAQQRWSEALTAFRRAQQLEPGNPETLEGLGRSALHLRDVSTAQWAVEKLRYADRQAGLRLQSAIVLSTKGGQS